MIEGAEILKKTQFYNSEPSTLTHIIIIIAALIIIVGFIKSLWSMETSKIFSSLLTSLTIAIVALMIIPKTYTDVPAGYQYDVYAKDDEVIKALYENYEVISANGNIYTIRDKAE